MGLALVDWVRRWCRVRLVDRLPFDGDGGPPILTNGRAESEDCAVGSRVREGQETPLLQDLERETPPGEKPTLTSGGTVSTPKHDEILKVEMIIDAGRRTKPGSGDGRSVSVRRTVETINDFKENESDGYDAEGVIVAPPQSLAKRFGEKIK